MSRSLIIAVILGALAFGLFAAISLSPAESAASLQKCEHEPGSTLTCEHNEGSPSNCQHSSSTTQAHRGTVAAHGAIDGSPVDDHEEKMLTEALSKKPDHAPVLLRMAALAATQRQFEKAIGYLERALRSEPKNVEVRLEYGRILFESGRITEDIEQTQLILKDQPENADALYNLGAIYGNIGDREKAGKYWDQLISSKPESESGRRAKTLLAQLRKQSNS